MKSKSFSVVVYWKREEPVSHFQQNLNQNFDAKFNIYEWRVSVCFYILRAHEMTPLICALEFSGPDWM